MEFTLLYAAVFGIGAMWLSLRLSPKVGSVVSDPFGVLMAAAMTGLFAGRLGAMILTGTNPLTHPADILLVRGGVDTGVASMAALGAIWWTNRTNFVKSADALAASALFGLAGWQAGCLFRDACLGTTSDLPWAMSSASGFTRHPTEIYAAIGFLIVGSLIRRAWPPRNAGYLAALALVYASLIRLVTEPLRPVLGNGAIVWYLLGTAVGLAAIRIGSFFAAPPDKSDLSPPP